MAARNKRNRRDVFVEPVVPVWGDTGVDDDFEALYAAAYVRLVRVLALACGSQADAEEVVQEAFVRLLPRWSRVREYSDPEAWVRGVAFRILSNRRRGRAAAARTWARFSAAAGERPRPPDGDRVDVARALAMLPAQQRHVVVLHHLLGLPVEQIADELAVPVGTVKSRLSRGRAALAPLLLTQEHHA
jgi:RNA polymerase sigma-70 factor (ECF subfamily)